MARLLQSYVLDVIGHLPADRAIGIQGLGLHRVFHTQASAWRDVIREALHLSDTIDIAILDLWYRNGDIAARKGAVYEPGAFAANFVDHFLADGSKVDVWPEDSLDLAKANIAQHQRRGPDA